MTLYYTGTQGNIDIANAQISDNLGLPFRNTETWAFPRSSYSDPTFYFFIMPDATGWTREDGTYFTQEQMINGVVNVTPEEPNPNWWPPFPP